MVTRCIKIDKTNNDVRTGEELRIPIPNLLNEIIQEVKQEKKCSDKVQLQIDQEKYILEIKPDVDIYTATSLSGNSRLAIVLPPKVEEAEMFVRSFAKMNSLKLEDVITGKGADMVIERLKALVADKNSFAISGTQGTGKSTLAKCLYELAGAEDEIIYIDEIVSRQDYLDALKYYNRKKQVIITHHHRTYSDYAKYMEALLQAEKGTYIMAETDNVVLPYNMELAFTLKGKRIVNRMVKLEKTEAGVQEKVIFYYDIEKNEYHLND